MEKVISKDGTPIAVDKLGSGPALILVDGAMCSRGFGPMPPLAKELASQFTVYHYDRRGRGDSGNGFDLRGAARDRRSRCRAAVRRRISDGVRHLVRRGARRRGRAAAARHPQARAVRGART